MREQILSDLSSKLDSAIVHDLISSYENVVAHYRKGYIDGCLSAAGKFVENSLRAIEFIRTGTVLTEIKHASSTKSAIEKDKTLPESLRTLIPRVALSMIYDIRSKRGAVHVKEIDPRQIDALLAVHSTSWIIAEFLRLYHVAGEAEVSRAMASLMHTHVPFVETFGDEVVVTRAVKCEPKLLLLLINAGTAGLDRRELGRSSKHRPPTVTTTLKQLDNKRFVHQTADGKYHITGSGEQRASELLASD